MADLAPLHMAGKLNGCVAGLAAGRVIVEHPEPGPRRQVRPTGGTYPLQRLVASLMVPTSLLTMSAFLVLNIVMDCCTAMGTIFSNRSEVEAQANW